MESLDSSWLLPLNLLFLIICNSEKSSLLYPLRSIPLDIFFLNIMASPELLNTIFFEILLKLLSFNLL